jgi:hypothetical protein
MPATRRSSIAKVCRARCMFRPLVTPGPTSPAACACRYHQRCTDCGEASSSGAPWQPQSISPSGPFPFASLRTG